MTQMMPNMWTLVLMMNMMMMFSSMTENHFQKPKKMKLKIKFMNNKW